MKWLNSLGLGIWAVMLCMFMPPVGIAMLYVWFRRDKPNLAKRGQRLLLISLPYFFLTGIAVSEGDWGWVTLMMGGSGLMALGLGLQLMLGGQRNERYIAAVTKHELRTAKEIAKMMKRSEAQVMKDLARLTAEDLLPGYRLDVDAKTLCYRYEAEKAKRAIVCQRCGGTSLIEEGAPLVCHYCGSAMQG